MICNYEMWITAKKFFSTNAPKTINQIQKITRKQDNFKTEVKGWVRSVRKHKSVTFIDVVDGSTPQAMQVVIPPKSNLGNICYGSSVCINGTTIYRPKGNPDVEIMCKDNDITVIGKCDPQEYPFNYKDNLVAGDMRQYMHLRLRQRTFEYLLRVRNNMEVALHKYFQGKEFTHIHTPVISSNDCEGAGELFSVTSNSEEGSSLSKYFQCQAYLTVSSQLHLESCVHGIRNVYTMSPVFRAEKTITKQHLSEFYMFEAEMAFFETTDELMDFIENAVKFALQECLNNSVIECNFYHDMAIKNYRNIVEISLKEKYVRITYSEAIEILKNNESKLINRSANFGEDLNAEQERFLTQYFKNIPVFVYNYPKTLKPFYVRQNKNNNNLTDTVDVLFPYVGELCGGSIREDNYELLVERLKDLNLVDQYAWYADLRKFGGVPHGGFGLGFDRFIKFLLGINKILDVVPFPRAYHTCQL